MQHLYEVRSPTAATLILIFNVVVPFAKAATVFVALFCVGDALRRRRMLQFVEAIAKWSMVDVFVVALFIAYLAAQASQTPPGDPNVPPPLLAFTANFELRTRLLLVCRLLSILSRRADISKLGIHIEWTHR